MQTLELGQFNGPVNEHGNETKATSYFSSPDGQKALRELTAFNALVHLDRARIHRTLGPEEGTYSTDDYATNPDMFLLEDYHPAVLSVDDGLIFAADDAFTHISILEEEAKSAMSKSLDGSRRGEESAVVKSFGELLSRLSTGKGRVVVGSITRIKQNGLKIFAVSGDQKYYSNETKDLAAKQLAQYETSLLFWSRDDSWIDEQLKMPEFALYAAFQARIDEASARHRLFMEYGDIVNEFGGVPIGPEVRYHWHIVSPNQNDVA